MKYVIVIPARGGSKRIPNKNIKELCGKPLIWHTLDFILNERTDIDIFVSTDSEEIKECVSDERIKIIDRPATYATDTTPTGITLKHASEWLASNGYDFDYMIHLQCTQPLKPKGIINETIKIIEETKTRSLLSVSPIIKKLGKVKDDKFIPWNYTFGQRSQDMEPLYFENGLIYATCRELINKGKIIDNEAYPYIINHPYANVDIDTDEDFRYAEYLMR